MSVIMGFVGPRGDGKTLAMTAALIHGYKRNKTIYSNYGLKFPPSEENPSPVLPLRATTLTEFADADSGLQDAIVAVDEIHVWLDSRSSQTKRNKVASYMVTQSRKRDVDVFYTTQLLHQVEKRVRDNTDIIVKCENLNRARDRGRPLEQHQPYIRLTILQTDRGKFSTKYIPPTRARKIARLYDTNQIIPFE